MSNPLLPPGELLLLTVDRAVERNCEMCHGKDYCDACEGKRCSCTDCHGTGRVTRRLRGWVRVNVEYLCGTNDYRIWVKGHKKYYGTAKFIAGCISFLSDAITAAYLDRTLPPEIAKNLTEVDCE